MGENRVRGLDRAVVRRQMMEKLAKKHNDPEGVGSMILKESGRYSPGASVVSLIADINGQRVTLGSSRQVSPMWRKSKRLQLTPSLSDTRDSEGDLCQ